MVEQQQPEQMVERRASRDKFGDDRLEKQVGFRFGSFQRDQW